MGEQENSQHGSTYGICMNMLQGHDKSSDLSLISSSTVPFEAVRQAASSSARTGQKNNQRVGGWWFGEGNKQYSQDSLISYKLGIY